MSDTVSDQLFLNTNLSELNTPHKLSRYILQLPHYKNHIVSNNNNNTSTLQSNSHSNTIHHDQQDSGSLNDLIISNKLSEFAYQQQLNGKFFLFGFNKPDFDNMMKLISPASSSTNNDTNYDWIWNILSNAIHNSSQITLKINKLEWIHSSWNKYQLNLNHKNNVFDYKMCECQSVNKCIALKRVIMVLHFYHLLIDEIDKDHDLLSQYFAKYNNIYNDYQHILSVHLSPNNSSNDKNKQRIQNKIALYIKCDDINKCKSYKRRNSDAASKCIENMKCNKMNEHNMLSFCCELLDIIHCRLIHNVAASGNTERDQRVIMNSNNTDK